MPIGQEKGTVLDQIIAARRDRIAQTRKRVRLERVQEAAERRHERRDFRRPDWRKKSAYPARIAGSKQASPSAGVLRTDYHSREIAQGYEAGGADALSVVTEEQFFKGSLTDLIDAGCGRTTGSEEGLHSGPVSGLRVRRSRRRRIAAHCRRAAGSGLGSLHRAYGSSPACALVEAHTGEELDRAIAAGAGRHRNQQPGSAHVAGKS